jgi:hypothetical protein
MPCQGTQSRRWLKVELEASCSCQNALTLLRHFILVPRSQESSLFLLSTTRLPQDIFEGSLPPQTSNQQPFVRGFCCNCLFPRSPTLVQTPGGPQRIADFESTTTDFCHSFLSLLLNASYITISAGEQLPVPLPNDVIVFAPPPGWDDDSKEGAFAQLIKEVNMLVQCGLLLIKLNGGFDYYYLLLSRLEQILVVRGGAEWANEVGEFLEAGGVGLIRDLVRHAPQEYAGGNALRVLTLGVGRERLTCNGDKRALSIDEISLV